MMTLLSTKEKGIVKATLLDGFKLTNVLITWMAKLSLHVQRLYFLF